MSKPHVCCEAAAELAQRLAHAERLLESADEELGAAWGQCNGTTCTDIDKWRKEYRAFLAGGAEAVAQEQPGTLLDGMEAATPQHSEKRP